MTEPRDVARLTMIEPEAPATREALVAVPLSVREAARRVLARDGLDVLLQPWQAAWLISTSEGREGVVPQACGAGKGWLQARLDEELSAGRSPRSG